MPTVLEQIPEQREKIGPVLTGNATQPSAPTVAQSTQSTTEPTPTESMSWLGKGFFFLFTALFVWFGIQISEGTYYTPRSTIGFFLGVGGASFMLAPLIVYPLRKRIKFMGNMGGIKSWFRLHMVLGLAGPILIMFHTTFQARSMNGIIALICMGIVVVSGLIGVFFYSKIHMGLDGRRATFKDIQEQLSDTTGQATSRLSFAPRVERCMKNFGRYSLKTKWPFPENVFIYLTLGLKRRCLGLWCRYELTRLFQRAQISEFPGGPSEAKLLVSKYLKGIQQVAQFRSYERIFSLWHVLHLPFIFLLVATGVFHILAVYMY